MTMSQERALCDIDPKLMEKLKDLRFTKKKVLIAFLIKIKDDVIQLEEEFEDITIEQLAEEVPYQQPRYIVLSYPLKHADGRISYPLMFIFISPQGCKPELQMKYAGSKLFFTNEGAFPKVAEYRSIEEMTDESIQAKLL